MTTLSQKYIKVTCCERCSVCANSFSLQVLNVADCLLGVLLIFAGGFLVTEINWLGGCALIGGFILLLEAGLSSCATVSPGKSFLCAYYTDSILILAKLSIST